MNEADLRRINDARHQLLHLHKQLLDGARNAYEREHGRVAPADYLRLLIEDASFGWLRPMTELIVRIDEWLDDDAATRDDAIGRTWLDDVSKLLSPDPALHEFHQRYAALLQDDPDVVIAHAAVVRALRDCERIPTCDLVGGCSPPTRRES